MKKVIVYLLGVITGIILTLAALFVMASISSPSSPEGDGVDYFPEEQVQKMDVQEYQVFQVLSNGYALATSLSNAKYGWYMGPAVLIIPGDDLHFYDQQKVAATKGKKFVQVGTYRYETPGEMVKTVPAITLKQ